MRDVNGTWLELRDWFLVLVGPETGMCGYISERNEDCVQTKGPAAAASARRQGWSCDYAYLRPRDSRKILKITPEDAMRETEQRENEHA